MFQNIHIYSPQHHCKPAITHQVVFIPKTVALSDKACIKVTSGVIIRGPGLIGGPVAIHPFITPALNSPGKSWATSTKRCFFFNDSLLLCRTTVDWQPESAIDNKINQQHQNCFSKLLFRSRTAKCNCVDLTEMSRLRQAHNLIPSCSTASCASYCRLKLHPPQKRSVKERVIHNPPSITCGLHNFKGKLVHRAR